MAPWRPLVSVILPVLNEESHIQRCLRSVFDQSYPDQLVEVIVADGGSSDRTVELVRGIMRDHPTLILIENLARIQAAGLNLAIARAGGAVIARVDGHATLTPEYLEQCVDLLASTGADNVGGRQVNVADSAFGEAVAMATASPLGVGGARYRYATEPQEVLTVFLGCFRAEALQRVGGYNPTLAIHEDYELNHRLRETGGRIVFSPDIKVTYCPRSTPQSLVLQYFRYGRGKARVARRQPRVVRPYHLVPPAAVVVGVVLSGMALSGRRAVPMLAVGAYASVCLIEARRVGKGIPINRRLLVAAVFPLLHGAWGSGFWVGLAPDARGRHDGAAAVAAAVPL